MLEAIDRSRFANAFKTAQRVAPKAALMLVGGAAIFTEAACVSEPATHNNPQISRNIETLKPDTSNSMAIEFKYNNSVWEPYPYVASKIPESEMLETATDRVYATLTWMTNHKNPEVRKKAEKFNTYIGDYQKGARSDLIWMRDRGPTRSPSYIVQTSDRKPIIGLEAGWWSSDQFNAPVGALHIISTLDAFDGMKEYFKGNNQYPNDLDQRLIDAREFARQVISPLDTSAR